MQIRPGIIVKLFLWYSAVLIISCGTILVLFANMQRIMKVSDEIVNKKYRISSNSKRMIDSLLTMEESEKKYGVLKRSEYIGYFVSAQKEYQRNLAEIMLLRGETEAAKTWDELDQSYQTHLPEMDVTQQSEEGAQVPWIDESVINDWMEKITSARTTNEQEVETSMVGLHHRGQMAVQWGLVGAGVSILVGLNGIFFLTLSMNRPLRELRRGIRSISHDGISEPIRIFSKDEFGELARAFNEMAARLREEDRIRSDFISMLSHEIRTPLTSIRESVNLIAEEVMGTINERQRRFLEIASLELERISNLLNHLMQVSRIEVGALKIMPHPMDAGELAEGSIYRLLPAAEAKGVSMLAQVEEGLPQAMGDYDNLQQVLLNLLGNAIKFSTSGGEVAVRVEALSIEGKNWIQFSVKDGGPGIPEDEQSFIFHKYYRVPGIRDQVDGVGLGLSISKQIVEAHGGTIWVDSRMGQGSVFGFRLPVIAEDRG
ncbi:MAG TPA: sensor histidine kinase [Syntrophobacteraceae bacterium]|nr:sensor histidine kinase [Syntrophobacteraceae bacterium]HBD08811.1 sensor histidine kinase [Syntrophobacteraceae bacterium]